MRLIASTPFLRDRARALRQDCTVAESLMWERLRGRRFRGLRFRRQRPIGPYIVDFYCPDRGLVVEVDGSQHLQPDDLAYDEERTLYLEVFGVTVVRFTNQDVLHRIDDVVSEIALAIGPSP